MKVTALDVETMARTIFGEARGEKTDLARQAVGHVIINRAEKGGWWGNTITTVCLWPKQFSCWEDHNRAKLQATDLGDPAYRKCMFAALMALRETDITNGANHYHARSVEPLWSLDDQGEPRYYVSIGSHKFYRGLD